MTAANSEAPDSLSALKPSCRETAAHALTIVRDGVITGGMIPKIEGCIEVVEAGVEAVVVIDGRVAHCVLLELFTEHGVGTLVTRRAKRGA